MSDNGDAKRAERNRKRRAKYDKDKQRKIARENLTLLHNANQTKLDAEWERRRTMSKKSQQYRSCKAALKSKEL